LKDERDYRDYLDNILRYAEMGERITMGVDFETFCRNDEKTLAAIQILEVIGEASKSYPNPSRIDIRILIPQNQKAQSRAAFLQISPISCENLS
jgi:uncharacterized protein with HEPN domain